MSTPTPTDPEAILASCRQQAAQLAAELRQEQANLDSYARLRDADVAARGRDALAAAVAAAERIAAGVAPKGPAPVPPAE